MARLNLDDVRSKSKLSRLMLKAVPNATCGYARMLQRERERQLLCTMQVQCAHGRSDCTNDRRHSFAGRRVTCAHSARLDFLPVCWTNHWETVHGGVHLQVRECHATMSYSGTNTCTKQRLAHPVRDTHNTTVLTSLAYFSISSGSDRVLDPVHKTYAMRR